MSFLDDVPQDWTRPELPELRDLLVLSYRRPTAAEQIADAAGIAPGTFPFHDNMRATWTALIQELGNQNRLHALVAKAAEDPAAAAYQPRFRDMLGSQPARATPQPVSVSDVWKGDDPKSGPRLFVERLMERRSRLMNIALAAGVLAAARSVVMLSLRFGAEKAYGTGFLIQDDLLLTNYHNVVHEDYGAVTSVVAEFDYEENFTGTPLVRKGLIDSIVYGVENDWAVIRLESSVARTPLKLGTPYDVGVDDAVVIIQHPKGAYKQFALESLAIRHIDGKRVQYVADTQQGSSGSPVFNTRMHVIALHHAETETTVEVEGKSQVVWRNQGINIAQVMSELTEHHLKFDANA